MNNVQLKQFKITCRKCGSDDTTIINTLDSDAEEGAWGAVTLRCNKCETEEKIAEAP